MVLRCSNWFEVLSVKRGMWGYCVRRGIIRVLVVQYHRLKGLNIWGRLRPVVGEVGLLYILGWHAGLCSPWHILNDFLGKIGRELYFPISEVD